MKSSELGAHLSVSDAAIFAAIEKMTTRLAVSSSLNSQYIRGCEAKEISTRHEFFVLVLSVMDPVRCANGDLNASGNACRSTDHLLA